MASESSKAELKQKRRKAARTLLSRDWEYEAAVDEAARGPKPYQRAHDKRIPAERRHHLIHRLRQARHRGSGSTILHLRQRDYRLPVTVELNFRSMDKHHRHMRGGCRTLQCRSVTWLVNDRLLSSRINDVRSSI